MTRFFLLPCLGLLLGGIIAGWLVYGNRYTRAAQGSSTVAWSNLTAYQFNEAYEFFHRRNKASGAREEECQFGEALALLDREPHTQANVHASLRLLQDISAHRSPQETMALLAKFFQARIYADHLDPADYTQAQSLLNEVLRARSGNPVVESAGEKLVMLVTQQRFSAEERGKRLDELEAVGGLLVSPGGKREYHYSMGEAYRSNGNLQQSLAHFIEADRQGITRWQTELAVWLDVAEIARITGDHVLAISYYRKIITKYPRDQRRYLIEERLRGLEAQSPAQ